MTSTPGTSRERLLVSHVIRLKGVASLDVVIARTGLPAATVRAELSAMHDAGHATERTGRVAGWTLTPDGKAADAAAVAVELEAAGVRDEVDDAYRRFLAVNGEMLALCTDWQLRDGALNDHTDASYDASVFARLHALDAALGPILEVLAAVLDRFAPYPALFAAALARVDAGDHDWLTRPIIDSYHTVWFELHEDLLSTLRIERASEVAAT